MIKYEIIVDSDNVRLDKFLSQKTQITRNQIENAIKNNMVLINNTIESKSSKKLKVGDCIIILETTKTISKTQEVDFDVDIIYEDDDLMVLNKPYNLTVHPAPSVKEATLVDWLKTKNISLSTLSGEERHGIVHRLDKGTSGAIIIAKNNESHQKLSNQLETKTMGRYYLAIIDTPLKENITIDKPIGRNQNNRLKMDIVPNGRNAKTSFFKLCQSKNLSQELIACKLYTGRTHQIRVHLGTLHRHILGDSLYGFKGEIATINRIFLHAYCIYFEHPSTKRMVTFMAPLKSDMQNYLNSNFNSEDINEKISQNYIINCWSSPTNGM